MFQLQKCEKCKLHGWYMMKHCVTVCYDAVQNTPW